MIIDGHRQQVPQGIMEQTPAETGQTRRKRILLPTVFFMREDLISSGTET
jgi:hypothetical protein